jgi:hypothetical protein
MMKINKNESGFSAVEVLLVILILVVIGGIGYMVYHNNHKTVNTTSTASTTHVVPKASPSSTQPAHTSQEATAFVQSTYNKFLSAAGNVDANDSRNPQQVGLSAVEANLTSNFYTQATASQNASVFTCENDFLADGYTASAASSNSTGATVPVTILNSPGGNSSGSSTTTTGMTVNVDLNSLLITSVTCPAGSS